MYLAVRRGTGRVSTRELRSLPAIVDGSPEALVDLEHGDVPIFEEFRDGLHDAMRKASAGHPTCGMAPEAVFVGLTSFWRRLTAQQRRRVYAQVLCRFRAITDEVGIPCFVIPLSDHEEARLERRAVEYAARHSVLAYSSVDLVISGGVNEIKLSPQDDVPPTVVPLDLDRGREVVRSRGVAVWDAECLVQFDRAASVYGWLARRDHERINVIATGSTFYAGRFAGLVGEKPEEHGLASVLQRLEERLRLADQRRGLARETLDGEVANLLRIRACLSSLFPERLRDTVHVVFARDWTIDGGRVRSTWTSGFFIKRCVDGVPWSEETPAQRRRRWMVAPSGWLSLAPLGAVSPPCVQCFEDERDAELHEVPYSERMSLLDVMPASPKVVSVGQEVVWGRVATIEEAVGLGPGPVGLRLALPAAEEMSRFLVVGFVSVAAAARAASTLR